MKIEDVFAVLETALDHDLNQTQELVLLHVWEGKTYSEIAEDAGYNPDYIKSVGSELWRSLSDALGEPVSKRNFRSIIKRRAEQRFYSQPGEDQKSTHYPFQDWGDAIDTSYLVGRVDELTTLETWILQDKCRLVSVLGMGGIGKTALAICCAERMQSEFDVVIWRSLRNAPAIDQFLMDVLQVLTQGQTISLPDDTNGKLAWLMAYLRQHRCLLMIDQWESVLESHNLDINNTGVGHYCPGKEGYGQLLRLVGEERHQSCVLLTSREKPIGLAAREGDRLPIRSLKLQGLKSSEVQEMIADMGILGSEFAVSQLVERYSGNLLALKLTATVIRELFDRDVSTFLSQNTSVFGEINALLEQQFVRLSSLEWKLLCQLARQQQELVLEQLQQQFPKSVSAEQLLAALRNLQWRSLVEIRHGRLTVPNLISEYFKSVQTTLVAIAG